MIFITLTLNEVGGGAAGAIIVEDAEEAGIQAAADEDATLPQWLAALPERVLVLQQIGFAQLYGISKYSDDLVFKDEGTVGLPAGWRNYTSAGDKANNDHGEGLKGFNESLITSFTLVNGEHKPTVELEAGQWARWRILNAGAIFALDLTLQSTPSPPSPPDPSPHPKQNCDMQLIALDGVYIPVAPRPVSRVVLPPASRADILIKCSTPATLELASGVTTGASGEYNGDIYWNPHMATVKVSEQVHNSTTPDPLPAFSVARPYYLKDLQQQKSVSKFSFSFQDVQLVDNDTSAEAKVLFPFNGDAGGTCTFNGLTYKAGHPLLTMNLDSVQEWNITGVHAHPLHLHINPMQIQALVRIQDGIRTEVRYGCDAEYNFFCIGDWVDVLQMPDGIADSAGAIVRFRVADFTGEEVLHCHYLIHEDQGCISYAQIVNPGQNNAEPALTN